MIALADGAQLRTWTEGLGTSAGLPWSWCMFVQTHPDRDEGASVLKQPADWNWRNVPVSRPESVEFHSAVDQR